MNTIMKEYQTYRIQKTKNKQEDNLTQSTIKKKPPR